jgi:peroxiredoxin Q/BCP
MAYGACDDPSAAAAKRIGVIIGADGRVKEYLPKVTPKTFPEEALKLI